MRIRIFVSVLFFLSVVSGFAQDSTNSDLIKVWGIDEFTANGKKFADEDMLEIVVDFRADGCYSYWEENEIMDGVWEMSEDGGAIYFDKGTQDEMVWSITSLSADRLEVKCNYGGSKYRYVFKPKVKKEMQENQ